MCVALYTPGAQHAWNHEQRLHSDDRDDDDEYHNAKPHNDADFSPIAYHAKAAACSGQQKKRANDEWPVHVVTLLLGAVTVALGLTSAHLTRYNLTIGRSPRNVRDA